MLRLTTGFNYHFLDFKDIEMSDICIISDEI